MSEWSVTIGWRGLCSDFLGKRPSRWPEKALPRLICRIQTVSEHARNHLIVAYIPLFMSINMCILNTIIDEWAERHHRLVRIVERFSRKTTLKVGGKGHAQTNMSYLESFRKISWTNLFSVREIRKILVSMPPINSILARINRNST